ncbi:MAG: ATPase, partial [Verrucomicrobiota bacterium]|nr:ATPase [Verrucomicrobiota bacterium]
MSDFVQAAQISEAKHIFDRLRTSLQRTIKGKNDVIEQVLVCLAAGGHLLLEDLPGLGKTTL